MLVMTSLKMHSPNYLIGSILTESFDVLLILYICTITHTGAHLCLKKELQSTIAKYIQCKTNRSIEM